MKTNTNTKTALLLLTLCLTWLIELSLATQEQGRLLSGKKKGKKESKRSSDDTILVGNVKSNTEQVTGTPLVKEDITILDDPLFSINPYTMMLEGPEIGRSKGVCTVLATPPNAMTPSEYVCVGTYVIYNKGKITISGDYQPPSGIFAVTGGTGYYKGVSGELTLDKIPHEEDSFMNVLEFSLDH